METEKANWTELPGVRSGIKIAVLAFMVLLLLIPLAMIRGLVSERQARSEETQFDLISQNGGHQAVEAPRLVIPYSYVDEADDVQRRVVAIIPEFVVVTGDLAPRILSRGIYEAPVYEASITMTGSFRVPDRLPLTEPGARDTQVAWDRAELVVHLGSVRGIRTAPEFEVAGHVLAAESASSSLTDKTGITARIGSSTELREALEQRREIPFEVDLSLSGGGTFTVSPVAESARYSLRSSWTDPSFTGSFLPTERSLSDEGFQAEWSATAIGMGVPPVSTSIPGQYQASASEMGVALYQPVSSYQQAERSVKYGPLFIVLPFVALFLLETFGGLRVHPVQYLLVAAAKIVFYLLLLSLSEHLAFPLSYAVGSLATIAVLAVYVRAVAGTAARAGSMAAMVTAEYLFLYAALQSQDYALLIGSIGLFVVLAAVMISTRGINWYSPGEAS